MFKNTLVLLSIYCLCVLTSTTSQAEIYSWVDSDGNTIYSDQKPSDDAKPTESGDHINYYTAPVVTKKKPLSNTRPDALATLTVVTEDEASEAMTEQQCQKLYNKDCDSINNWRQQALEECGDDERCTDPDFLDKKYRPRTLEEQRKTANRSAIRNNLNDKKIALFLTKKYSNYCANQAAMYCQSQRSNSCDAKMRSYCDDPRELEDIFARYDNLTPNEKKQIIAQAKEMVMANGDNQLNYEQVIVSLIDILISQALMGI
jgi:hypothetical protein